MTENNDFSEEEAEDTGDELGFYDFLEVVGKNLDLISQRSIEQNINFDTLRKLCFNCCHLVETYKEDSRQQWQQTKDDVHKQKRLLRNQLEKHIRALSENLNKPNFIRTRDKITFTIGVANTCFSPLIGMI